MKETKNKPTSIRLTRESKETLAFLRSQPYGFNFNKFINHALAKEAKKRGLS